MSIYASWTIQLPLHILINVVPCYAESFDGSPSIYHARFEEPAAQGKTLSSASASQTVASYSDSFIGATLTDWGLSQQAKELLSNSWREGTKKQYDTNVRRWRAYCCQRKIKSLTPPVIEVENFLTSLFESGFGYSGVASARSALGHVLTVPGYPKLAAHPLIQRLLKGIGNVCPPKPRYTMIWDTTPLIKCMASLRNEELDFQRACWKTSALLTVLSGQRVSTLHKFKLSNLQLTDTLVLFNIAKPLKQSMPSHTMNNYAPCGLFMCTWEKGNLFCWLLFMMIFFSLTGSPITLLRRIPWLDGLSLFST